MSRKHIFSKDGENEGGESADNGSSVLTITDKLAQGIQEALFRRFKELRVAPADIDMHMRLIFHGGLAKVVDGDRVLVDISFKREEKENPSCPKH